VTREANLKGYSEIKEIKKKSCKGTEEIRGETGGNGRSY
jgi:hypothetical protein